MPDMTIVEQNQGTFYGPFAGVHSSPQPPLTSPITITAPGSYRRRVPLDVSTVVVESWGGGGYGAHGKAGTGGLAGAGAGYAKCTLAAPLFVAGSVLIIDVGAAGDAAMSTPGGDSTVTVGNTLCVTGGGGDLGSSPGAGTVAVAAGISDGITADGTNGGAASGTTGGDGGAAGGTGGGAGGAGGAAGKAGSPGVAPGGGGGGGGSATSDGGDGGAGRVVISWT